MSVICRAYTSHEEASRAVHGLLAAGLSGDGLRVLMGEPQRDARLERQGEFAGSVGPEGPVGDFANHEHRRAEGAGGFAGRSAAQRGGSFADADRDIVTSYPAGVERMDVTGHRQIHELLNDAGLDDETAAHDVEALHEGRILVLADAGNRDEEELRRLLDQFQGSAARVDQ